MLIGNAHVLMAISIMRQAWNDCPSLPSNVNRYWMLYVAIARLHPVFSRYLSLLLFVSKTIDCIQLSCYMFILSEKTSDIFKFVIVRRFIFLSIAYTWHTEYMHIYLFLCKCMMWCTCVCIISLSYMNLLNCRSWLLYLCKCL